MKYGSVAITAAGSDLIQKLLLTQEKLTLTCVRTGSGAYSQDEDLAAKTAMKEVKQTALISLVRTDVNYRTKISAVVENTDIEDPYYMTEVGLFAQDPDLGEILFSLAVVFNQSEADYIPAYDGTAPVAVDLVTYLQLSSDVIVVVAADSGYASLADFLDLSEQVTENDTRLSLIEYMIVHNDFYAPINVELPDGAILVDDDDTAILADWKYVIA